MKRFYTFIGLLGLATGVTAQGNINDVKPFKLSPAVKGFNAAPGVSVKAPGDELWRDDFDTPGDWTIDNGASSLGWSITDNTTGTQGWPGFVSNGMSSTSGGNYAEMYNGDPTTGNPAPEAGPYTMTSEVITLGLPGVDLIFEQEGALFQDNQEVYVTLDAGISWLKVGDNVDMGVLSSTGGSAYPEPHTKKLDLGAVLGAQGFTSGNIQLRFSWSPDVQNISYGWLVDDVRIVEKEGNDLAIDDVSWFHNGLYELTYTAIPTSQLSAMTFQASVTNKGAYSQPNTTVDVTISGAASGAAASTPITMVGSASQWIEATSFTPSATGTYTASYVVSSDSVDVDLSNNTGTMMWEVTDSEYGKDDGAMSGTFGAFDDDGDGIDDPYELVVEYELNAPMDITAIKACFGDGTADGTELYYNLYTEDGAGAFVPVYDGVTIPVPTYTLSTADLTSAGGANWVELPLPTVYTADPGTLPTAAVYAVVGYEIDPVEFAVSGTAADTSNYLTVFGTTAGETNYFVTSKPMMRLWEGPVSVDEETANVALGTAYPNPTAGFTSIPFTLINAASVKFVVTDVTGKVIENSNLGVKSAGEHRIDFDGANLSSGIYYYSVIVNGEKATGKINVAK